MNTNKSSAPSASKKINPMGLSRALRRSVMRGLGQCLSWAIVMALAACSSQPVQPEPAQAGVGSVWPAGVPAASVSPAPAAALPEPMLRAKSRWQPVRWSDVPGWGDDDLHEAWMAWLRSCERPAAIWQSLCSQVRRLAIADDSEQTRWMQEHLQPYRVEPLELAGKAASGLLTGYFEPIFEARRLPSAGFGVALWQAPVALAQRLPWYTRKEIDTLPQAQAQLKGREIAYLADPVDALILQIQGSGRLRITEPDGSQRLVRVAFAATNEQAYRSVGRWLLDQNLIRDASWPGIKAWIAANPQRVQELLWSNPRVVFFKEEAIEPTAAGQGPRGAQNVALTAGRSIAVDRDSIPLGTPVWMQTQGEVLNAQKLVLAQDVGSAILGAERADYYAGSGPAAGDLAGRLKQPLALWVFWPKALP